MRKTVLTIINGIAVFIAAAASACVCAQEAEAPATTTTSTNITTVTAPATVSVSVSVTPVPEKVQEPEPEPAKAPKLPSLAVACPVHGGKVTANEAKTLWGMLESAVPDGQYRLVSRAALKQLCAELGVPAESLGSYDFSKVTDETRDGLARFRDVNYLLVTEVTSVDEISRDKVEYEKRIWDGKNPTTGREPDRIVKGNGKLTQDKGSSYVCSIRVVDIADGTVVPGRHGNLTAKSLQELYDKIEYQLAIVLSDDKRPATSALLLPNVQVANSPIYLGEFVNTALESAMLNNGIRLQNLLSVKKILADNKLDGLSELSPSMFIKVGRLLGVKTLMQVSINRFEVTSRQFVVRATGASGTLFSGAVGGYLRIVSAQTGELLATIPFEQKFAPVKPAGQFFGWESEDFGKYYLSYTIGEVIMPQLLRMRDKL